jgi:serine/threonine-protein kinase
LFVRADEYRTMNALLMDPIPAPSSVAAVAPELDEIVMRALDREPANRFPTADALRAALDAYVSSLGQVTRPQMARAIRALFPQECTILPNAEEPSAAAEIGPAVISRATLAMPSGGPVPRREVMLLGMGAVAAAALGGFLGWAGKRLRGSDDSAMVVAAGASSSTRHPRTIVEPLPPRMPPEPLEPAFRSSAGPTDLAPPPAAAPELSPAPATGTAVAPAAAARLDGPRRPQIAGPRRSPRIADLPRKKNPF